MVVLSSPLLSMMVKLMIEGERQRRSVVDAVDCHSMCPRSHSSQQRMQMERYNMDERRMMRQELLMMLILVLLLRLA